MQSSTVCLVCSYLILANDDDSTKNKKVDKSVTVDYKDILKQDPEQTEFLEGVKAFAKSQLKDWPKSEFKLHQFFEKLHNKLIQQANIFLCDLPLTHHYVLLNVFLNQLYYLYNRNHYCILKYTYSQSYFKFNKKTQSEANGH